MITEVEAYTQDDPASHSFRGPSARNASMFSEPGTLYVYRAYGIHWCLNVVVGPVGDGSAVLVRAGTPIVGLEHMVRRRGRAENLCNGPGRLAQALGVEGSHDGHDLLDRAGRVTLDPGDVLVGRAVPRVGISKAVDVPWRWLADGPVMSSPLDHESP
jgi:DNA-3-methyladenine glycosylase